MTIRILGHHRPATAAGGMRMLVTVTVLGSAGPIRFVASEGEPVAAVIGITLRCYARKRRFPALGCDVAEFHLFCAQSDYMDPLDPSEHIGAKGGRNFVLCKKQLQPAASSTMVLRMATGTGAMVSAKKKMKGAGGGGGGSSGAAWKACLGKSLHPNIPSH